MENVDMLQQKLVTALYTNGSPSNSSPQRGHNGSKSVETEFEPSLLSSQLSRTYKAQRLVAEKAQERGSTALASAAFDPAPSGNKQGAAGVYRAWWGNS